MGTSTIVLLTSRQSAIEQRLVALRQLLSQHIQGLHEDLSQVNRFREAFATVKTFLEHAGTVLSTEDPNKTAEQPDLQNRLDQLKELLTQFQVWDLFVCLFVCGWQGGGGLGKDTHSFAIAVNSILKTFYKYLSPVQASFG